MKHFSQAVLEPECTLDSSRHATVNCQLTKECETMNAGLKHSANSILDISVVFHFSVRTVSKLNGGLIKLKVFGRRTMTLSKQVPHRRRNTHEQRRHPNQTP